MGAEELRGIGITAQLHLAQLQPGPVRIQIGAPHKGQVHAQISVHSRAVDAYKDAVRHGRPSRRLCGTVETGLRMKHKSK